MSKPDSARFVEILFVGTRGKVAFTAISAINYFPNVENVKDRVFFVDSIFKIKDSELIVSEYIEIDTENENLDLSAVIGSEVTQKVLMGFVEYDENKNWIKPEHQFQITSTSKIDFKIEANFYKISIPIEFKNKENEQHTLC